MNESVAKQKNGKQKFWYRFKL